MTLNVKWWKIGVGVTLEVKPWSLGVGDGLCPEEGSTKYDR